VREALARIEARDPLEERVADLERRLQEETRDDAIAIICFSGEWDRLFAAFVIATGALAMDQRVDLFVTFWAAAALRDRSRRAENRQLFERLMGAMLPAGPERAPLSKMNFCGLGKAMLRWRMRRAGVDRLDAMVSGFREMGGRMHLCEMSSGILGVRPTDLIGGDAINPCGVATFLRTATRGKAVLFI
jgi:peroxiredoxin family protein